MVWVGIVRRKKTRQAVVGAERDGKSGRRSRYLSSSRSQDRLSTHVQQILTRKGRSDEDVEKNTNNPAANNGVSDAILFVSEKGLNAQQSRSHRAGTDGYMA